MAKAKCEAITRRMNAKQARMGTDIEWLLCDADDCFKTNNNGRPWPIMAAEQETVFTHSDSAAASDSSICQEHRPALRDHLDDAREKTGFIAAVVTNEMPGWIQWCSSGGGRVYNKWNWLVSFAFARLWYRCTSKGWPWQNARYNVCFLGAKLIEIPKEYFDKISCLWPGSVGKGCARSRLRCDFIYLGMR